MPIKGTKHTLASRQKMSEAHKGKHPSEETRQKMSAAKKGIKHPNLGRQKSEEEKRKISEAQRGIKSHSWGKHLSSETRKKMSEAHRGEKSYLWQGGISFLPYSPEFNRSLKRQVKERDRFFCQLCGEEDELCIHHIDYDKKNNTAKNLITLCRSCHGKTNHNKNNWQEQLTIEHKGGWQNAKTKVLGSDFGTTVYAVNCKI